MRICRDDFLKWWRRRHSYFRRLFFGLISILLFSSGAHARPELTTNGEVAGLAAQFVDVNGIRTRYYEMGQGEPLVLVHGGQWSGHASANIWSKDIPLLAKRFHVFAPDKIGSGMTGNPADDNDLNIQGEADHIYDFIRAMKMGMVHLIGAGTGGDCVFFVALQHQEVVRDLVLIDTNIAGPEEPRSSSSATVNCLNQSDEEAWRCHTRALSSSPDQAFNDEYFMAGKYMSLLPKSQETAAKLKGGAGGELARGDALNRWKAEWFERIKKESVLEMPVLIYWGQDDIAAPIANGEALREVININNSHVQMIAVDHAGHFPFREYPERFVSDITSFINWARHPDNTQSSATVTVEGR